MENKAAQTGIMAAHYSVTPPALANKTLAARHRTAFMTTRTPVHFSEQPSGPSSAESDSRRERLHAWAGELLSRSDLAISVASADASFRRYFRVAVSGGRPSDPSWIVMDAPPDKENLEPFIRVADMLVRAGVNAPRVLAQNLDEGYLLLSDLGDHTYLSELESAQSMRVDELYADALDALVGMQTRTPGASELPPYDAALLRREMELFPEWFLDKHLGIVVGSDIRAKLVATFDALIESALAQPRVFVHRDYHSRNLMVAGTAALGANPGVLDFQDAVYGPIAYDLVSLLRDCYIAWPIDRVRGWVRRYRRSAAAAGLDAGGSEDTFMQWFDWMGVQRHLKAVGIFARLRHRDSKPGYIKDIPRTLSYIETVASAYPPLRDLSVLIRDVVQPVFAP